MKKRWLSLLVENHVGILAQISGLFAGKAYNLESISAGTAEDESVSRLTIGVMCNDITFEQIKKQLNRSVGIIHVVDLTNTDAIMKELMFIKVPDCTPEQAEVIKRFAFGYGAKMIHRGENDIILESMASKEDNDAIIEGMKRFPGYEVVRGGVVAILPDA